MKRIAALVLSLTLASPAVVQARDISATLYKAPGCGCCDGHAEHLKQSGFDVTVVETPDLSAIKARHGVPEALEGCHTIEVGGYVVEGHVPATIIKRLLAERPAIKGVSLPGMPNGSPGMGGRKAEPFKIHEITEGPARIYAVE